MARASQQDELLGLMSSITEQPIIILIDALDEADPPEQQEPGFTGGVKACGNKALHLAINHLAALPPNYRFIFTTRPDAVCEGVGDILQRAFAATQFVEPWQLRQSGEDAQNEAGGGKDRVMVHAIVIKECGLDDMYDNPTAIIPGHHNTLPLATAAERCTSAEQRLDALYSAYHHVFSSCEGLLPSSEHRQDVMRLLQVLMAAQEPLSHSMLQQMRLQHALERLPKWGVLFYLADHHVYPLHKSLRDWLLHPTAAGVFAVDVSQGHLTIGSHLLPQLLHCKREDPPTAYALKYAIVHLAAASNHQLGKVMLDEALGAWEYIHHVFKSDNMAAGVVRALGSMRDQASRYSDDTLRWMRRCFHDFLAQPDDMEVLTLRQCPVSSFKYTEAVSLTGVKWYTTRVLGGSGNGWPADEAVLKVRAAIILALLAGIYHYHSRGCFSI